MAEAIASPTQIGDCTLYQGDAQAILAQVPCKSIPVVVTSPPYDDLRAYEGACWEFEPIAQELTRVLMPGGVLVWVVGDATINGSETGTSFRQALYFKEHCGLSLHDTMIYHKLNPGGARGSVYGYWQVFEFMFVFSKGTPRTFHPLEDRPNAHYRRIVTQTGGRRNWDGTSQGRKAMSFGQYGRRGNIWSYPRSAGGEHPAVFPEDLARDHIASWSNAGERILDPFMGAGTTGCATVKLGRSFLGIELVPRYFSLACRRIQDAANQLRLFPVPTRSAVPKPQQEGFW